MREAISGALFKMQAPLNIIRASMNMASRGGDGPVSMRVLEQERQALVLPEIAVQQNGAQSFVFRIDAEGLAQIAPVRLGSREPGRVEVLEGIAVGDRIVIDGAVKLRPGQPVREAGRVAAPVPDAGSGTADAVRG